MTQGFPFLGFLHVAAKSLVFCRHFNVENQANNSLLSPKWTWKRGTNTDTNWSRGKIYQHHRISECKNTRKNWKKNNKRRSRHKKMQLTSESKPTNIIVLQPINEILHFLTQQHVNSHTHVQPCINHHTPKHKNTIFHIIPTITQIPMFEFLSLHTSPHLRT